MDIALQTNDSAAALELRNVQPAPDHPSFSMRLFVQSDGFRAEVPFWIERHCVEGFLAQLRTMNDTLAGEALLQPEYELDRVSLSLGQTGRVVVSGELGSEAFNFLKFRFETDQTCLGPLVGSLDRLLGDSPRAAEQSDAGDAGPR